MEQLISIGVNLLLSLAGLLIFSLLAVGKHLKRFNFTIFFKDNKVFWIWAFTLQLIFAVLIGYIPEAASAIKTLSGIDLGEPMAFLTSGAALAGLANWTVGKTLSQSSKIGNKAI